MSASQEQYAKLEKAGPLELLSSPERLQTYNGHVTLRFTFRARESSCAGLRSEVGYTITIARLFIGDQESSRFL